MALNNLHDVLVDMVKDLYHAEKQLVRALPKMARAATAPDLQAAFKEHLAVTQGQVERLDDVFAQLEVAPKAKVCHGMLGIVEEGAEVIEERDGNPAAVDAALIAAAQKVEHYEVASYGSAKAFAEALGLDAVAGLLGESLDEEKEADVALSELAETINAAAASASPEDAEPEPLKRPAPRRKAK